MPEPPETKAGKTIVYIDGQNFLHRCAESLKKSRAIRAPNELTNIDFKLIFERLFPKEELEIRYYSVTKVHFQASGDAEFDQKGKRIIDDLRLIKSNIVKQGLNLRSVGRLRMRSSGACANCGYISPKIQEKGVDVGLVTDMVKDSALGKVAKAVIVSSDTDMVPAIEAANSLGVKTVYVGIKGSVVESLKGKTRETRVINNATILEAYISAMNFVK